MIQAVRYFKEDKRLQVMFTSYRIYEYYDVSEEVYEELLKAPSKGRYFLANIRGTYRYSRLS